MVTSVHLHYENVLAWTPLVQLSSLPEMKTTPSGLRHSASDLSNHLACRHCTALDIDVASGKLAVSAWNSPDTQILRDLGAHENDYVQSFIVQGLEVVNLRDVANNDAVISATLLAMRRGADVIVQAALGNDRCSGERTYYVK